MFVVEVLFDELLSQLVQFFVLVDFDDFVVEDCQVDLGDGCFFFKQSYYGDILYVCIVFCCFGVSGVCVQQGGQQCGECKVVKVVYGYCYGVVDGDVSLELLFFDMQKVCF